MFPPSLSEKLAALHAKRLETRTPGQNGVQVAVTESESNIEQDLGAPGSLVFEYSSAPDVPQTIPSSVKIPVSDKEYVIYSSRYQLIKYTRH